jgi:hypothetical protein
MLTALKIDLETDLNTDSFDQKNGSLCSEPFLFGM